MKSVLIILLLVISVKDTFMKNITINKPGFWICTGLKQGTQIPHPENCSSYFVCNNGFPDIVTCEKDLIYDRHYKVCNWPVYVHCKLGEYPPYWNTSHPVEFTTEKLISTTTAIKPSTTKSSRKPQSTTAINCITLPTLTPSKNPSNSTTGAKDDKGNLIDPLEKYNPLNVQCFHNGLYFLPHPAKCDNYFICSNHILYLHKCGYGTYWNYEQQKCEVRQNSKCYYFDQIVNKSTTRKRKIPPTASPTIHRFTEKQTTIKLEKLPECPSNQQKFLPHPTDCTKYYICIAGMPALTTCPNGMYWDEREEWCGYPEFTYCRAAIVKLPVKIRKLKN